MLIHCDYSERHEYRKNRRRNHGHRSHKSSRKNVSIDYRNAPTTRKLIKAHVKYSVPLVEFLCSAERKIRRYVDKHY